LTTGAVRLSSKVCAGYTWDSVRGVGLREPREPKLASLLVAARWPSQHPSCRHRHRCRLHGPRQSVSRLVDRIERPPRTSLTFDAPHTELTPEPQKDPLPDTCWTGNHPPVRLSGAPPPVYLRASTPPELAPEFGPRCADRGSRSVPVGSHHFDGFLRDVDSGPVASRYRTWGSLGFRRAAVAIRRWLGRGLHSHQCSTLRRFAPRR
jgi:hypothetical protein